MLHTIFIFTSQVFKVTMENMEKFCFCVAQKKAMVKLSKEQPDLVSNKLYIRQTSFWYFGQVVVHTSQAIEAIFFFQKKC